MSDPFAALVSTLTNKKPKPPRVLYRVSLDNKTETLRQLLRERPSTCAYLSDQTGMPRTTVTSLLCAGIKLGQILKEDGVYRIAPNYEAPRIRSAIELLRAHGYTVTKESE